MTTEKEENPVSDKVKIPLIMPEDGNSIVAYALTEKFNFNPLEEFVIKPAPLKRQWMEETSRQHSKTGEMLPPHAYKCLPLNMANTCGWTIHCPVGFTVWWNGNNSPAGNVTFEFDEEPERWTNWIQERFGVGTFTMPVPYLWRTPPGWQIFTRGPTNSWKTNCQSLDAVMETEWLPYPFFQTWKIKRPNEPVRFEKNEPYAFIHLINLEVTKNMNFYLDDINEPRNKELFDEYNEWLETRIEFQDRLFKGGVEFADKEGDWQKDYTKGILKGNKKVPGHHMSTGKRNIKIGGCPFMNPFKKKEDSNDS